MLNKCKIDGNEVLFYGEEKELNFPEYLKIETLEKDIKLTPEVADLIILSARDLIIRTFSHKRTRDIKLSEQGIESYNDLKAAYFLVKYKKFDGSKSIRDLITEKYADVVDYVEKPSENSGL